MKEENRCPDSPRLDRAFDTPEAKGRYVRRLFATIAPRYDLITRILSFGLDRGWKRRLMEIALVQSGDRVLDLACGTGDITFDAAERGATATGLDITRRMIELAENKVRGTTVRRYEVPLRRPTWIVGDMAQLPVASNSIDVVTTGYGLRNTTDLSGTLAEIHRVLRSGGRLCSLDFDRPESPLVRGVYLSFLTVFGSTLGWVLHADPDTYRYIPESIRRYPGARGVVDLMRQVGFREARHVPVLGGLIAIHIARK